MQPRRLSILGMGLLGGSIGLAAKKLINGCKIAGYTHRASTLEAARALGVLDEPYAEPGPAVRGADLVILCTPVLSLEPLLDEIAPNLADGATVTDVGSTKRSVVEAAQSLLRTGVHFVGSHPMAGSEKRGVQFARAELFDGAVCITTPTSSTDSAALDKVEGFWRLLGMRTTRLSPQDHDRLLADVSHLPHAVAAALVAMQDPMALKLCGKGFLDLTRIADGDAGLWRDILLDNRDNAVLSIQRLIEQLRHLEGLLKPGHQEELYAWLDGAARRRQALLGDEAH